MRRLPRFLRRSPALGASIAMLAVTGLAWSAPLIRPAAVAATRA